MIYIIGGAPRVGKSILAQQVASRQKIGWISTDLLMEVLRAKDVDGTKSEWDASPDAITAAAEWFFPCLERFIWGVNSQAGDYVIEGVDFLPKQVTQLSTKYNIRSVFLGCAQMTFERFDQYPGHSPGYASLPEELRRQFAKDIPTWSEFIRQEAGRFDQPYIDMSDRFHSRLNEAEQLLISS